MMDDTNIGTSKASVEAGRQTEDGIAAILYTAEFDADTAKGAAYQASRAYAQAEWRRQQAVETGNPALAAEAAEEHRRADELLRTADNNANVCIEKCAGSILLAEMARGQFADAIDEHSTGAMIKEQVSGQPDDLRTVTQKARESRDILAEGEGPRLQEASNLLGSCAEDLGEQKQRALGLSALAADYYNSL
jgi:hypothetical protein